MYHTNAAYKQKVAELPQDFRMEIEVVFDESTGLTENVVIPPEDIFEAGLSENVFLNTFCVGSSVCTEFWVRIFNQDGKYKNDALATAEIHPKVTLYDSESGEAVDTVPLGIFYVEQITIQDSDLRLACYDKMRLLEKAYTPKGTQTSLLSVAQDIALSVLASCSTTPADMPALSLVVDDTIFQGYTKRQVLELIAEAGGRFAIFDPDGALCFKWFTESGIELSGDKAKEALELNGNTFSLDGNVVKVTGVRVVSEDTELARVGTDDYLLTINENPIAAAHPSEVAQYVLASMADTQYIPCKWQRIGGDPSLQVGDILTIVDNKETFDETQAETYDRYPLFLSARSWTFNCGGFSDVYTSSGNAEKDLNTDKGMTVSKRLSQLAKRITETKSDLTAEMDDRQKALLLFNETIAGSMGLYTTYKSQEDGSVVLYMHDEKELEQSQTIYTFGASGFAWTNDGWNDGNPVWENGFSRDGNAILNAIYAYTLTADVIKTGLLQSQNGTSWINLDDGTFQLSIRRENKELLGMLGMDEEGWLSFHGRMKPPGNDIPFYIWISDIHPNERTRFMISDESIKANEYDDPDIFAFTTKYDAGDGVYVARMYSPCASLGNWSEMQSRIDFHPNYLMMKYQNNGNPSALICKPSSAYLSSQESSGSEVAQVGVYGETAKLYGKNAFIAASQDNINITTNADHGHCWFNWWPPEQGYSPVAYDFGNGSRGGYAPLYASNFITASDPKLKQNIKEASLFSALSKIKKLMFYSYDFKQTDETERHCPLGVMAPEAPEEIRANDGKAIKLYEYINLTAKAVQELTEQVEEQAQKINALEARLAVLEA